MNEIYGEIYNIVELQLKENSRSMPCAKNTFLYAVNAEPGICDGKALCAFEKEEFLQAVYVSLLKRLPDQEAEQAWEYFIKTKSNEEFREVLLDALIFSPESITKGTCMKDNRIVSARLRQQRCLLQILSGEVEQVAELSTKQKIKESLYKVYLRLPIGLKKVIRKLMGKD